MMGYKKWKGVLQFIWFTIGAVMPADAQSQWAVSLSWLENTEPDLLGYRIHFGTSSRIYTATVDVGIATTYRVENLQSMVEYFFAVTAYDNAGNESDYSSEVSCVLGDTIAPSILTAQAISSTEVLVEFTEKVNMASAQEKGNYMINPGITVLSAVLDSDRQRVRLSTSEHSTDGTFTLTVSNVTDIALPPNVIPTGTTITYSYGSGGQDVTPPTITAADVVSPTQLHVYFSEPLDPSSVNSNENYSLNNDMVIQSADLDTSGSMVRITTSTHEYGKIYILLVSNIKDLTGNAILANSSYSYTYEPVDDVGPTLTLVSAVDANHLDVMFSEEVDRASAEIVDNYAISDDIDILSARLNSSGQVVHLETDTHEADHLYYLTVNNVRDVSPQANAIEPNSRYAYVYEEEDLIGPTIRSVSVLDSTHLEVVFSETVERVSAENVGNYTLTNNMSVLSAQRLVSGDVVILETTAHQRGQVYVLSVTGVCDNSQAANEIEPNSTYTYVYGNVGNDVGPSIVEARALSSTEIRVLFSQSLDSVSAEMVNHYSLNNSVNILTAVLEDSNVVHLTTTPHEHGKIYILHITKVHDKWGNEIITNSLYAYVYEPADIVGPTLSLVSMVDANNLDVMFSEKVDRSSAEYVTNYSISGDIQILSAHLDGSERVVHLETSHHEPNRLYLVTVRGVHDVSHQANKIESNSQYAYMFEPQDRIEPTIKLVNIIDATHLKVVFSENVKIQSAENIENYSLNNGLRVNSAKVTGNGNEVILHTDAHETDKVYVLLVSGVCDNSPAANEIIPNSSYTYVHGSSTTSFGPTIVDLEATSDTEIRIEFNMRISKTSAEMLSNYWFNHNLQVRQAKLDDSGRVVYLSTSKHQDGALYTALVNNIAAEDNPQNTIRPNSQYFYIFNAEQGLVPKVTEIAALGETFIVVTFSAPVDRITAENHRNYIINGRMSVLKTELDNSERVVYLETSRHLPSRVYILSISGVKPSDQTHSMSVNSSMTYVYLPQLRLEFLSDAEVQMSYIKVGKEYYVDRNYVITCVPDYLDQKRLVKTSNNDRANSNNRYIVIQSNQASVVYVAYDSRTIEVPTWLKNNFTKTDDYVGVSDLAEQLTLWKRTFAAGEIVLGGNNAAGTQGVKNMYIVIVVETQGRGLPGDNDLERSEEEGLGIPHSVELLQNYPNPFNPQTTIHYELPSQKQVTVTVYNILGCKVKELFNGSADVGHHRLVWNGTDEHGNPVGAGIYFCRLVSWNVSERNGVAFIQDCQTIVRKMTLLK